MMSQSPRSIVLIPAALAIAMSSTQVDAQAQPDTAAAAAAESSTTAARVMTQRVLKDTYVKFDFPFTKLDDVECLSDLDGHLCPTDEEIPCGGLDSIEEFCRDLLYGQDGADAEELEAADLDDARVGDGTDALAGCINYVSWEERHLNCCPSDHCFDVVGDGEWGEWEYVVADGEDPEEEDGFVYRYKEVSPEDYDDLEGQFGELLNIEGAGDLAELEAMLGISIDGEDEDEVDKDDPMALIDFHEDVQEQDSRTPGADHDDDANGTHDKHPSHHLHEDAHGQKPRRYATTYRNSS